MTGHGPKLLLGLGSAVFILAVQAYASYVKSRQSLMWRLVDLQVYRSAGQAVRHSGVLYDRAFQDGLSFTYPPISAAFFAVASLLSLNALKLTITTVSILSLLVSVWIALGIPGRPRTWRRAGITLTVTGLVLWSEPVQHTLYFGQVNLLLLVLVLADLALPDDRKWKGIGVGLAAGCKLTPAIFIVYLLVTRRFRAAAVSAVTFFGTVVVGFVALPAESERYWIEGLFAVPSRVGPQPSFYNQSLYGAAIRLFHDAPSVRVYCSLVVLGVGMGGLALAAWIHRRGSVLLGIGVCALTMLLVSPISWVHHWVWLIPLLVGVAQLIGTLRNRAFRWLAWIGFAGLLSLFYNWPGILWSVPETPNIGRPRDFAEYRWHGFQLVIGNLDVVIGLVLFTLSALWAASQSALLRRPAAESGTRGS